MQNYKEINGNDYVKDSRTTINETMRSIQSMNSGTAFPTNNLFEGMKCYRTDLKKTYTLTDVENNTWAEDDTASKLSTARKINITGDATGAAAFDGSGDISINTTVNRAAYAVNAKNDSSGASILSTYLKRSGGAMTGALNFANSTWNRVGDDSYMGDHDISGTFCVKGANGETGIALVNVNNEDDNARISYGGGNINFNKTIGGNISGNAATATKLQTPRTISLTGNASGSANFDGSGNVSINTSVNNTAQATKLAGESGNNYIVIDSTTDSWSVIGNNSGYWLKSIRTNGSAPPYSIGNYSAAVAFGGDDTKGIITHAYNGPLVKFAGGNGSTAQWKFSIYGGRNNETYDLNNFPTKTGGGASGTWPISISGNADTVDGYHASDIINRITAANTGGIVAASLTANGYVKFANGLILQWGSYTGDGSWHHYTFPIAFSTVFDVIDGYSSTDTSRFYGYSKNITNTGFDMRIDSSETGRYLAIGI